jgi:hypothetical protein
MAHTLRMVSMLCGLLVLSSSSLEAQNRLALLIGNAAYTQSPLRNPVHDATDMATMLRRLGFEVTLLRDADKPTMERAIGDFTRGVPKGSLGLFYFSGHGAQIDGLNYLLPIGAEFTQPTDVKYHAVAADWILGRMDDSGMAVKLLLLDACRNNPFGRSWSKALDRGLGVMDAPQGTLIAYATSPKKTASDGVGHNSPYTARLLREIPIPGRPIELVFKAVRLGVQQETHGEQTPWEASSLTGDFYFAPAEAPAVSTSPPSVTPPTSPTSPQQLPQPPVVAQSPESSPPHPPSVLLPFAQAAQGGARGIDNPFRMELGVPSQVSLDSGEQSHFGISLPAGEFKIILDARRAGGKFGNLLGAVSVLDRDGGELAQNVIVFNVVGVQHRAVHYFSQESPLHIILKLGNQMPKLDNKQDKATFWLSIFEKSAVTPPLFASVVPQPMQPGETKSGPMDKGHNVYYLIALKQGSYKAFLDFGSANGKQINLMGSLQLLNEDGGFLDNLIEFNRVEANYRGTSTFTVKEDAVFMIRVYDMGGAVTELGGIVNRVNYATKIVPVVSE